MASDAKTKQNDDAPLIDLNEASIKKMIAKAKRKGYITYDELNEALPSGEMSSDQIDAVIRDYLAMGPEGRRADPRIGRDRQALIMSGSAILQALMRLWPTDRLSVADRGLREGLLYAQMSADGVLEDGPY